MASRRKKDRRYETAVTGAWRVLRLLIYVFILLLILFVGRAAYRFGYLVFDQHTMAADGEGQDVTVVIKKGDSVLDIGKTLESKGLIERPVIFWVQERLSEYHDKLLPGKYLLNTSQTVDAMLEILAGENTEGQPSEEEPEEEKTEEGGDSAESEEPQS